MHMVQDSSVSHEGGSRGVGAGGGAVVGRLGLVPPEPRDAFALGCHLSPQSARFAPGPSCLLQLGSHQPRDNKQAAPDGALRPRRSSCLRDPREACTWPPPRRPGGKTHFSLSLGLFLLLLFKSRRAAGTRHRL